MRGGDDACLAALGGVAAEWVEAVVFEHTEEFGLKLEGCIADLVEEDRAVPSEGETAAPVGDRTRERAAHVAEQLGLEQRRGQRGAVHRDEGLPGVRRVEVDRPGDELLSRPRLAADEHARPVRRQLADQLVDLDHPWVAPHQLVQLVAAGGVLGGATLALPGSPVLEQAVEHALQVLEVEWLGQEVEGAFAHRRDGRGHVVVGGHDDDVGPGRSLLQQPQQLDPVQPRHAHVGEHQVGPHFVDRGKRLLGAGRGTHLGLLIGQDFGE